MSPPRVLGVEVGDRGKKHPGREDTDPPRVEFDREETSTKAQVASFKTPRFQVSAPTAVVLLNNILRESAALA